MQATHYYPPDLASYVVQHWPDAHPLQVSADILCEALSVCFQASFTAEEGRPTRFRLLLTPPDALPTEGSPNEGVLRLCFDRSRPFSADELRRLSPSAPFEMALICASVDESKLRIWGISHSGPAWLAPTWGGRSLVPNWTYDPIIHVTGPGQLAVRCAGKMVGGLDRGALVNAALDAFDSKWLPALFAQERAQVHEEHDAAHPRISWPTAVEPELVRIISQHMLRRAIQLIRSSRHGGMILFVDESTFNGSRALRLKYRFAPDEPPRRYRTLLLELMERISDGTGKSSVGWADFTNQVSPEVEKNEQAIFEISRLIAALAATDGAVVLNKRYDIIGFGAEVSAELPSPEQVWRSLDLEADRRMPESVESVGTRHRAAYRFVRDHPKGLAIVVSNDGAVRFVANRAGEVHFWEQAVSP